MTVVLVAGLPVDDNTPTNIPLGVLSIGTVLKHQCNRDVVIVPMSTISGQGEGLPTLVESILDAQPEWVGFSTMCNTFAGSLLVARELKRRRMALPVVFGGPHASVAALATLEAFDFVDLVASGECEETVVQLQSALDGGRGLSVVPGLAYRHGGEVCMNPAGGIIDVNKLPLPDYSLISWLDHVTSVPLDVGRGCPFRCTYCSTGEFFRNIFRLRSVDSILELIRWSITATGRNKFSFIHDNLTARGRQFDELCRRLVEEGIDIEWSCSARADCLNPDRLDLMRKAGCVSIYMGIETGSSQIQRDIHKKLRLSIVPQRVSELRERGMRFTASFMMGFPTETTSDLEATIDMIADVREHGGGNEIVQLHMLAPIPATPMFEQWRDHLRLPGQNEPTDLQVLDDDFVDRSIDDPECYSWVTKYPGIFGAHYYLEGLHVSRSFNKAMYSLLIVLHGDFPNTARLMRPSFERTIPSLLDVGYRLQSAALNDSGEGITDRVYGTLLHSLEESQSNDALRVADVLRVESAVARVRSGQSSQIWVPTSWDVAAWLTSCSSSRAAWDARGEDCVVLVTATETGPRMAKVPQTIAELLRRTDGEP